MTPAGSRAAGASIRWWWWVAAAFALQFSAWAAWLVLAAHHPVATVPLAGAR